MCDTGMKFHMSRNWYYKVYQKKIIIISKFWGCHKSSKTRFSPTHIHNISWPSFDNWETNTWVQLVSFSKSPNPCPFNLLFHHAKRDSRLHVWFSSWFLFPSHLKNMAATYVILHNSFHHIDNRRLHVWNFTTLETLCIKIGGYWKWVCYSVDDQ